MRRPAIVAGIQAVLSSNLLNPSWRKSELVHKNHLSGHCYTASEVLYHLWGKQRGFTPRRVEVETSVGWVSHWYLQREGDVLDPTSEQFGTLEIPYHLGKGCGFLTKTPSNRAREVIRRMGVKL